jgi:hypothetical protein
MGTPTRPCFFTLKDLKMEASPYESVMNIDATGRVRFRLFYKEDESTPTSLILDSGFFKPELDFIPHPILHFKPSYDFSKCWEDA